MSRSVDNGKSWSNVTDSQSILYAWGRHLTSLVTLPNGQIVMTYVVRQGYQDAADGLPQFGIEAVISRDHGVTWDLDHRYLLAVWKRDRKGPQGWRASGQRTATVRLRNGSLVTAFGAWYRNAGGSTNNRWAPTPRSPTLPGIPITGIGSPPKFPATLAPTRNERRSKIDRRQRLCAPAMCCGAGGRPAHANQSQEGARRWRESPLRAHAFYLNRKPYKSASRTMMYRRTLLPLSASKLAFFHVTTCSMLSV